MGKNIKSVAAFFRKETVLCIAALLAVISMVFVPPDSGYAEYIDWDTLALLFSLMAVMKGFQKAGLCIWFGNRLLERAASTRKMLLVLVFLPFICSMFITNDVALITFVPFGLTVLHMAGQKRMVIRLVVLQTVAANLGSMLTPMGNPQNLYIYGQSGMGFGELCGVMAPYVLFAGICLLVLVLFGKGEQVEAEPVEVTLGKPWEMVSCTVGFILCLLGIFGWIPPLAIAAITALFLLYADKRLLLGVDYSLLGTFIAFFLFVGNIGRLESFKDFLVSILAGQEELVSILASQVISNVPAALLLSGFTDNWNALLIGCNLGGLGTLIASMASLISYKMVAKDYPELRKKYLFEFTICNIGLLGLLILMSYLPI